MNVKISPRLILALVLAVGVGAFAFGTNRTRMQFAQVFAGFWVGPDSTVANSSAKLTNISASAVTDVTFPAIAVDAGLIQQSCQQGIVVADAGTQIAVTNAKVGDLCQVGLFAPAPTSLQATFHCWFPATGFAAVKRCAASVAGLAVEDAGVTIYDISNQ